MTTIPRHLRDRLDVVARELSDISVALRPKLPTLADMYDSLGHAIIGSRLGVTRYGLHRLNIDVPAGCTLDLSPRLPGEGASRQVIITAF